MDAYQNSHYRLSDADRAAAMGELEAHYAAGRLSIDDYQQRLAFVQQANFQGEIAPLLRDLPPIDETSVGHDLARLPENTFTALEIESARKQAQHTRFGIFALSGVAGVGLTAVLGSALCLLIPVTVFILLYIMKVGPASWHAPSTRQLAAQRRKSVELLQAAEIAQRKQARKLRQEELKDSAIEMAQRSLRRFER